MISLRNKITSSLSRKKVAAMNNKFYWEITLTGPYLKEKNQQSANLQLMTQYQIHLQPKNCQSHHST